MTKVVLRLAFAYILLTFSHHELMAQAESQNTGSGLYWKLKGNATTNSGTNFLGTTDNVSLRVRTNNAERMVVDSTGLVGIGLATPNTAYLDIYGTSAGTNSLQLRGGNTSGSFTSNQILFGFNGTSTYRNAIKSRHNSTQTSGNSIDFFVWNQSADAATTIGTKAVMTIDGNWKGMVGIGTTTPKSELHITDGSSSLKAVTDAGGYGASLLITDNIIPRIYFEDAGQPADKKLMGLTSLGQTLSIGSLIDNGSAWDQQYILSAHRDGNVGIGIANGLQKLHVNGSGSGVRIGGLATGGSFITATSATTDKMLYADANGDLRAIASGVSGQVLTTNASGVPAWGSSAANEWHITGNASTVASTNFIGTTDAIDFVTRTNNSEKMRVTSGGNVGINVTAPQNRLDVANATRTGTHATGRPLYVTGTIGAASSGIEFRHDNGTQGIGFGYNTIYATGTNTAQDLGLSALGTGNLNFSTNGSQRMIILGSNGNVGMGTTAPGYRLDLANGTFAFGSSNVRTETRDNAGLQGNAGAQSGFFETSSPSNYPSGASSWWHLIDTRHSNNTNNYAMQIAGSFFDQRIYFRKTNSSAVTAWSEFLTTANVNTNAWSLTGNSGTNASNNFIGTTDAIDFVTRTNNAERMRVAWWGGVGIGTTGPTQLFDVQGGNARINNTFLGDVGHGSGWGGFSNSSSNNTTGYALLQNTDGAYTLINKQNTGYGWIGFRVANSDVAVILNNGYMGVGTTGPTSRLHVISDGDNIPVIYGVNTNSSAGTTSYGVRGECGSVGLGSAGVSGISTNSGQNEIGTLGDYSLWGAGVFGLGWASAYTHMPAFRDFGVFGTATFSTGTGVGAYDGSGSAGSNAFYGWGKMTCTGAKSASVPTTKGNQLVYCTESPEIWFEDFGTAQLQNGQVHVALDEMFLQTIFIDAAHPMHVFLQEMGNSNGLYYTPDANGKGFTVFEKNNGNGNTSFSYRIVAKRRFYQDYRFGVDAMQPIEDNLSKAKYMQPITSDPEEMRKWVEEQTRLKNEQAKQSGK